MTVQGEVFSFFDEDSFFGLESVVAGFFSVPFESEDDESDELDSPPLSFFWEPARL